MDRELFDQYLEHIDFGEIIEALWYTTDESAPQSRDWLSTEAFNAKLGVYNTGENTRPGLDLVIVKGLPRFSPLTVTKDVFLDLFTRFRLPKVYVQTALSNNGHFAQFTHYTGDNPSDISIVSQSLHSPIKSFGLALTLGIATNRMTCLLVIEDESRADTLLTTLQSRRQLVETCPLYLLLILAEHYGYRNETWRENLDLSIVHLETHIGMSSFETSALDDASDSRSTDPAEEVSIRDLHIVNTELVWLGGATNFEISFLEFVEKNWRIYQELRAERDLPMLSRKEFENGKQQLQYLLTLAKMREFQRQGLQQRAETQIGILYSNISQRDSQLNFVIAKDSRKIAQAARQDSKAMKTISVVTLFFLPATLVAVSSTGRG